jgi:hypothetical protein
MDAGSVIAAFDTTVGARGRLSGWTNASPADNALYAHLADEPLRELNEKVARAIAHGYCNAQ